MKAIVIDTETTGLDPNEEEILQLSVIDANGETLYNGYFKPERHDTWEAAMAVNKITPEMVADAPSFSSELATINKIFEGIDAIIGYNTGFDINFIKASGVHISENTRIIDVMRMFAPVYGEWNAEKNDYKWQKLIKCAEYYGYSWGADTAHDSLADTRATLFCYNKIVESEQKHTKRTVAR